MHENKDIAKGHTYLVTKAYEATYPDPITMRAGDSIEVSDKEDNWQGWLWVWCTNQSGKSGWVPRGYVVQVEGVWRARYDYAAVELSVAVGEMIVVSQQESGWLWSTNEHGKSGWVPAENVKPC